MSTSQTITWYRCSKCGYDLHELTVGPHCPECGTHVTPCTVNLEKAQKYLLVCIMLLISSIGCWIAFDQIRLWVRFTPMRIYYTTPLLYLFAVSFWMLNHFLLKTFEYGVRNQIKRPVIHVIGKMGMAMVCLGVGLLIFKETENCPRYYFNFFYIPIPALLLFLAGFLAVFFRLYMFSRNIATTDPQGYRRRLYLWTGFSLTSVLIMFLLSVLFPNQWITLPTGLNRIWLIIVEELSPLIGNILLLLSCLIGLRVLCKLYFEWRHVILDDKL